MSDDLCITKFKGENGNFELILTLHILLLLLVVYVLYNMLNLTCIFLVSFSNLGFVQTHATPVD